ncbi:uncharacterized protein PpBr36_11028 [Pyricularia pennisetigena]|uniref:uncharacterized protein n=1 Tax=Pyricularia pennisetigena TaxID=1578925 RepID=UPI00114F774C|nr:uncharacterized protein PpBr36_11028 [Pyricularia pennisetigena]TLS20757.1 hypothetical protein PpBr36_11028 [Pyricularia pennisetigena]
MSSNELDGPGCDRSGGSSSIWNSILSQTSAIGILKPNVVNDVYPNSSSKGGFSSSSSSPPNRGGSSGGGTTSSESKSGR